MSPWMQRAGALYGALSRRACVLMTVPALLLWVRGRGTAAVYARAVLACRLRVLVGLAPCDPPWTGSWDERTRRFRQLADFLDRLAP